MKVHVRPERDNHRHRTASTNSPFLLVRGGWEVDSGLVVDGIVERSDQSCYILFAYRVVERYLIVIEEVKMMYMLADSSGV